MEGQPASQSRSQPTSSLPPSQFQFQGQSQFHAHSQFQFHAHTQFLSPAHTLFQFESPTPSQSLGQCHSQLQSSLQCPLDTTLADMASSDDTVLEAMVVLEGMVASVDPASEDTDPVDMA